jgi:Putative DNA-binding domain
VNSPTYEDLLKLIENKDDEGLHLEFKDIRAIFPKMDPASLSAAVSAFANSDGGDLIIGVSGRKGKQDFFLKGQEGGDDLKDTLERSIESNTSPPVVSYVVQTILNKEGHRFYWIHVERSSSAPHQNQAHIYYKRNGSSTKPMEHYEVEDVRSRQFELEYPLDIRVETDKTRVAKLTIRNRGKHIVQNVKFELTSAVPLNKETTLRLRERGLTRIYPSETATFYLGEIVGFLQVQVAVLKVDCRYEVAGSMRRESKIFDFQDFGYRLIEANEYAEQLRSIEKAITELGRTVQKISNALETIAGGYSSSGLHLADSTLKSLQGTSPESLRKYDIAHADVEGLRDVLGITQDQAREIYRNFAYIGQARKWPEFFATLPIDIQQKISERFEVPE